MKKFELPKNRPFVIAEISNAHNGSKNELEQLVEEIIKIKSDAIKFQFFKAKELLVPNHPEFKIYKNLEFPDSFWKKIFKKLEYKNIKIFVDVFSLERAKFAESLNVDGYKIHSSDIENFELLNYVSSLQKPILLSCSGCTLNEIENAISIIKKQNKKIVLMHGFQGFPTKLSEINLNRLNTLHDKFNLPIGFMDHVDGGLEISSILPLLALAKGAFIIEKHITLNRNLKGEDYESSLNPDEFKKMILNIKKLFSSLGTSKFILDTSELEYRYKMKKKVVTKKKLKKNSVIKKNDIRFNRTPKKTQIVSFDKIIGSRTKICLEKNSILNEKTIFLRNKVVAVIACRVDSTRLYAKPLQLIGEKFILELMIEQLKKCKLIDEIVLAISDKKGNEKFIEFSIKNNIKYVQGSDIDVLQRIISGAEYVNSNILLRVTSEDPIKYWQGIDKAIQQHIESDTDYTECISSLPEGTGFEIINLDALKKSHKYGRKQHKSEFVTSFINENPKKFKISSFPVPAHLQFPNIRLTVDNPEDLILIRNIWKIFPKARIPTLKETLNLINNNKLIQNYHQQAKSI